MVHAMISVGLVIKKLKSPRCHGVDSFLYCKAEAYSKASDCCSPSYLKGDDDDPTACGMGNASKNGGTKKATPPRTSK
eukprot:1169769-Amphidinium_carterae.1